VEYLPHEKEIQEYLGTIERLKQQSSNTPLFKEEVVRLEKKMEQLREETYSKLTAWERVTICRHPSRPHTLDYIELMTEEFIELHGDRSVRDDPSVIGGFATIGTEKFLLVGQEKGNNTESRIERNFGMLHPEGYRKAMRLSELAARFHLPILFLIDTPGAYPGLEAEKKGQAWAIASNLQRFFSVRTPIIILIIGEGCSGGAIGMGIGDVVGMLEHSYYSVISPEGCASILWKDAQQRAIAAEALKLNAEDLLEIGVIDKIIPEPLGGAHYDPKTTCEAVKAFVLEEWKSLKKLPTDLLLKKRYEKFRRIGQNLS